MSNPAKVLCRHASSLASRIDDDAQLDLRLIAGVAGHRPRVRRPTPAGNRDRLGAGRIDTVYPVRDTRHRSDLVPPLNHTSVKDSDLTAST